MLGLWLQNRELELREDLPEPVATAGEVVVGMRLAAICGTDLELLAGYVPFTGVPGHEMVGVVETPGEWHGRRVVAEITVACGSCRECRSGRRGHCERRAVLGLRGRNGAFAERLAVPVANLHEVGEAVPDEAAVLTEPLAAALEVLEQVDVSPSHHVVVIGDGRLGQLVARVLARRGCRLEVLGHHPTKLALLENEGIATAIAEAVSPRGADIVVECTGSPEGFATACRHLCPRGTLVLKSTFAGNVAVDLAALVVHEITVIGSRCGPFERALELLQTGALSLAPLVTARYPLRRGRDAFSHATAPGALKVLIEP